MAEEDNKTKIHISFRPGVGNCSGETVWADRLGGGRYRLSNTPFVATGLTLGDVVECDHPPDTYPEVRRVVERSGCIQVGVLFQDPQEKLAQREAATAYLKPYENAAWEWMEPRYLVASVPEAELGNFVQHVLRVAPCKTYHWAPSVEDFHPNREALVTERASSLRCRSDGSW